MSVVQILIEGRLVECFSVEQFRWVRHCTLTHNSSDRTLGVRQRKHLTVGRGVIDTVRNELKHESLLPG